MFSTANINVNMIKHLYKQELLISNKKESNTTKSAGFIDFTDLKKQE